MLPKLQMLVVGAVGASGTGRGRQAQAIQDTNLVEIELKQADAELGVTCEKP